MSSPTEFVVLWEKTGLSVKESVRLVANPPRTMRRYESNSRSATAMPLLIIDATKRTVSEQCNSSGQEVSYRVVNFLTGIGGRSVFSSKWYRFAHQTYAVNYLDGKDHDLAGGIRPWAQEPDVSRPTISCFRVSASAGLNFRHLEKERPREAVRLSVRYEGDTAP